MLIYYHFANEDVPGGKPILKKEGRQSVFAIAIILLEELLRLWDILPELARSDLLSSIFMPIHLSRARPSMEKQRELQPNDSRYPVYEQRCWVQSEY
jgi:hypothetical protein